MHIITYDELTTNQKFDTKVPPKSVLYQNMKSKCMFVIHKCYNFKIISRKK